MTLDGRATSPNVQRAGLTLMSESYRTEVTERACAYRRPRWNVGVFHSRGLHQGVLGDAAAADSAQWLSADIDNPDLVDSLAAATA